MPDEGYKNPHEEDIVYQDRRISRPDSSLPDWEVPDSTYRPVPIVWFTGALLGQIFLQLAILIVGGAVFGLTALILFALSLLASGMVWQHTMERGMKQASGSWRMATAVMLATIFAFVALVVLQRG